VVPVDGAGFYGTKNLGNRIAGVAMVKHGIGTREPDPLPAGSERAGIRVHDVNLIGEYNIAGEFWHVLPLLDELGLRVLCTLSGDARFREVQTMHRAEVNMMVCSKAMLNVARKLQERFGTPWFEGSFYGITDTSQALRDFARLIGDADLAALDRFEDALVVVALGITWVLDGLEVTLAGARDRVAAQAWWFNRPVGPLMLPIAHGNFVQWLKDTGAPAYAG
jgi:nitrogenase molybdenum-iron protein alpha/beta subunit